MNERALSSGPCSQHTQTAGRWALHQRRSLRRGRLSRVGESCFWKAVGNLGDATIIRVL